MLSFSEVDLLKCSDQLHFRSLTLPLFAPLNVDVVGLCNGLICFSDCLFSKFILVNPSTRQYKLLPPVRNGSLGAVGLGYDCSADEYKVVIIPEVESDDESDEESEAHIYGSCSNSWRQMDVSVKKHDGEYEFYGDYGKYTHGALHWIRGQCDKKFRIMTFDFVNEKLTLAEYHKDLFGNPLYVMLEVLGGRLCLCCTNNVKEGVEGYMDIWVMEEYGVRESWSKLVSFDRHVSLLAFSNCGRRLLFRVFRRWPCSCSLHWYDLDKKSLEHVDTWMVTQYHVCLQSLTQLEGKLR